MTVIYEVSPQRIYAMVADHVHTRGEPKPYGTWLREAGHEGTVVCRTCGVLPADDHSSSWVSLSQDARDHAEEAGHLVAVESWSGAIYGPEESVTVGGPDVSIGQRPSCPGCDWPGCNDLAPSIRTPETTGDETP